MSSVEEYRRYADECFAWAKQATTDSERELFLGMAQDWLRAATVSHAFSHAARLSDADMTLPAATPPAPVRR